MQIISARQAGILPALIACAMIGACGGQKKEEVRGTTPTTEIPGERPRGATPGAAAVSDANIAALINEANVADSSLAATALPKLTDPDVQAFAKQMMGQHHQLHVEGLKVAQEQNITPQLPSPDPFKPAVEAEQKALSSLEPGPAYDSTYIAHEIAIHRAVIDWVGQPEHQPENQAYQQYLKSAGPVLQSHLEEAMALQKKLSGASQ
jgi:predicted outer membrane protein